MNPKVFRLGKFRRWWVLAVGIIGFGALAWLMTMLFLSTSSENKLVPILLPPLLGMTLFTALLCGYMIWVVWSYRIEFFEDELCVSRFGIPFARQIRCSYEDITYVRRPIMKGYIEVIPKQGKSFHLLTIVEGSSDGLMDEFERRLEPEKFQVFLREELKRYSIFDKVGLVSVVPLLVVVALFFLPKFVARFYAWETAWPSTTFNFGEINGLWFDQRGNVWLANRQPLSPNSQIIEITEEGTNRWTVNLTFFDLVLADRKGQPWIIDYDEIFHWTGSSWKPVPLGGYTIGSYAAPPVVVDGKYWVSAYSKARDSHFLISLDLDTEEIQIVHLPPDLASDNFTIRGFQLAPDGSFLVMLAKPFTPIFFYSYAAQSGEWEKKMELVEAKWETQSIFGAEQDPWLEFGGFTIDKTGQVWVVLDDQTGSQIGRFDASSQTWQWSVIEDDCELCSASYGDIVVDDNGRAWVKAEYGRKSAPDAKYAILQGRGVDVFIPRWGQTAERVMRYTRDNSNYQLGFGSSDIQRTEDGRIWTAGNRLVWIDSSKPELPAPLPDWIANLISREMYIKASLFTIVALIVMAVIYRLALWYRNQLPISSKNS